MRSALCLLRKYEQLLSSGFALLYLSDGFSESVMMRSCNVNAKSKCYLVHRRLNGHLDCRFFKDKVESPGHVLLECTADTSLVAFREELLTKFYEDQVINQSSL